MALDETAVPVGELVRGACEILGLDPLYVANEGRFVAFVRGAGGVSTRRAGTHRTRRPPACIGTVRADRRRVTLRSVVGIERILDRLSASKLPRIC